MFCRPLDKELTTILVDLTRASRAVIYGVETWTLKKKEERKQRKCGSGCEWRWKDREMKK